jgi:hypothetical protein
MFRMDMGAGGWDFCGVCFCYLRSSSLYGGKEGFLNSTRAGRRWLDLYDLLSKGEESTRRGFSLSVGKLTGRK